MLLCCCVHISDASRQLHHCPVVQTAAACPLTTKRMQSPRLKGMEMTWMTPAACLACHPPRRMRWSGHRRRPTPCWRHVQQQQQQQPQLARHRGWQPWVRMLP